MRGLLSPTQIQPRSGPDRSRDRASNRLALYTERSGPDRVHRRDPNSGSCPRRDPGSGSRISLRWQKGSVLPQAPPTAAGRKKKARETPEEASGAGPSQPPRSRPKKGARRGGQAPPVEEKDPNAVEGPYMVDFEVIPDPDRRIRWGHVPRSARSAALAHLRERSITGSGLSFALDLPVHRPHVSSHPIVI
ncbi:hypothetical protein R1sor_001063 [Riccia sorocarpa]|uniref:Uncharacterized protein n=1 Tax=Riccia sorocarpa TaxID=122646 RepID=A0ABD3GWV8_9MARC